MSTPDLPITTNRLELRRFRPTDLDSLASYRCLPDVQRYLDDRSRDRAECKAALEAMCAQRGLHRPGDAFSLAVCRSSDEALVGEATLRWTDATASQAELRFIFAPQFRRQGYAKETVRAMLDIGFDHFNFHRIFARCGGENTASARLLKGLGMRLEAHYREHALYQGEWDEELLFAILDREWQRGTKVREITRHMVA